ncbi:MAG: hypothetical protein ABH871_06010 [Pseudomonadota bacterium]
MKNANAFIKELEKSFELTQEDLEKMVLEFHLEMKRGLSDKESSLKMLPTFIDRACGREKGKFIALDLGGTNFRVLQVDLSGDGKTREEHVGKYVIPKAVMRGTGVQLFNFIAQSIKRFINDNDIGIEESKKLGFTFSFPIKQSNIATGILINWTKGFTATGVVGSNVVNLLTTALKKYGLEHIEIAALANDTVGTIAAKSYEDPDCDVGIIFGTGTNACYREKISNIQKLKGSFESKDHMIINIEWGNFDKLPMTEFDLKLDKATNNPGKQKMEKMISGMYLGEIARLILSEMIANKFIFGESKAKFSKGNFKTRHMSLIESDHSEGCMKIAGFLEAIGILDTPIKDMEMLKKVCSIVSRRAARLSAAAISAVVTWMDPKLDNKHTIAIDGTLYEKYPHFRLLIVSTLKDMHADASKNIKLTQAHDGSGIGVAVVAAVATHKG